MARSRRVPAAGQQHLFGQAEPTGATAPEATAPGRMLGGEQVYAPATAPSRAETTEAAPAAVADLPMAAALRTMRTILGTAQVQPLPPTSRVEPVAAPPPIPPQASSPSWSTSTPPSSQSREPLRYGRFRLDGPLWEFHAAQAALRRDTMTGRDLRRHLAELEAEPQPPARPHPPAAGGEAGSASG